VAAGSVQAAEAGAWALSNGGNAADAAVAAQLAACAAEPILTGLLGAGIATVRFGGAVQVLDCFANVPSGPRAGRGDRIVLDYGVTSQEFHVGAATVAVPGLGFGILELHARCGRLPLRALAGPAIGYAEDGVQVTRTLAAVLEVLWPLCGRGSGARLLGGSGPAREGTVLANPGLARSLARLADGGRDWLVEVAGRGLGPTGVTPSDLEGYRVRWQEPLSVPYRGMRVYEPGPPSQGGPQVLRALASLGAPPPPLGAAHVRWLARALHDAETAMPRPLPEALWREGFASGYLGSFTTHVSAVDADGNAVSITSSLGETCGDALVEHGLLVNNFLGEDDVNPPGHEQRPGQRLMTMCSPALVVGEGQVVALGSGGSSRIRSALVHGVAYLVDHDLPPEEAVRVPRCHMEAGRLRIEGFGRPPGTLEALEEEFEGMGVFTDPGLYFGGLNVARLRNGAAEAAGDPRRSGAGRVAS
jgi:gamma-glutamyltranspeptidase/glutathione hydrolase